MEQETQTQSCQTPTNEQQTQQTQIPSTHPPPSPSNQDITRIVEMANTINDMANNVYFKLLPNVAVERFISSQEAFVYAVDVWPFAMMYLIPKIHYLHRLVLMHNVWDEYGNGDLQKCHTITFQFFLKSLGHSGNYPLWENIEDYHPVKKFIRCLSEILEKEDWPVSIAALGMIEYTYLTVSKHIHDYAKQILGRDDFDHYSLHETVDLAHSNALFEILASTEDQVVRKGLQLGYDIFYDLYDGLSVYLDDDLDEDSRL